MTVADLYIRVSTDEQAEKGYSQRDQAERLRKYCFHNNVAVGQVIYEDHSAKSFKRPEWIKYLTEIKKRSNKSSLVLFTKWDRFSRNAGDAYQMISLLRKNGVNPQAIEQPLDMAVPENKLMLAIYLASPEVENDRRALNVFYGMRKAKKEGRIMGTPPYGYINRSMEDGTKYIAIKEPEATNIIWAFNEIAKGYIPADHVRVLMNKREGRSITRNTFITAVRNTVYCGKIFISQHKQEESFFIQGKHEPLISEALFNKVQDVLNGKKKDERPGGKVLSNEHFPLRGILTCPKCGSNLTGSGSKGNKKIYYYYHCNSKCGFRYQAHIVNDMFQAELTKFEFAPSVKDILKKLLLDNYKAFTGSLDDKRKSVSKQIDSINERISKARDLYLSDKLDEDDYREIKSKGKLESDKLETELSCLVSEAKTFDVNQKLESALNAIGNVSKLYKHGDIQIKRAIASSIYPKKIEFDGSGFRTDEMNSIAKYIFLATSALEQKKNRHQIVKNSDVGQVIPLGFEPRTTTLKV
ncbi:recombinase family protein [Pedobacter agri]|uniref:recombinase family protein n=1 Tax=Pedobacter agri TaxID=454586 RepID=UPI002931116B|nr:recombinase family protein [Pedobacter agri]